MVADKNSKSLGSNSHSLCHMVYYRLKRLVNNTLKLYRRFYSLITQITSDVNTKFTKLRYIFLWKKRTAKTHSGTKNFRNHVFSWILSPQGIRSEPAICILYTFFLSVLKLWIIIRIKIQEVKWHIKFIYLDAYDLVYLYFDISNLINP